MKKEFVFAAKFDTSEFDRQIDQMQQKMKSAMAPAQMAQMQQATSSRLAQGGIGGIMSAPAMEAFQRATQSSRREMDQLISEQARGQERLGKIIAQRSDTLKKLQDQQKQMIKDSREELEIKEKIARVESNNQQLRETYRQRDNALNQAMDAKEAMRPQGLERLSQAYRGGGAGGAMTAAMRMAGPGTLGSIMSGMGYLGQQGSEMYRDISKAPIRTEGAMGSAVQGSLGRQVGDIYGRRTAFEQMYAPERQRAAQQSLEMLKANQSADATGTGFGMMKSIGAGIGAGAAAGSIVPGLGTGIGAALGGVGGFGKGIWDIMGNERQRSMLLSPFSKNASNRYGSILAGDMVNDYQTSYEGQKQQNPFKMAATQEYEQNFQRNLGFQRSTGLKNEGFYGPGGFMHNAMSQGFTPDMAIGMSQGVMGAGGSTRMGRDSSFGLQMQRGLDMTNASQVLGNLSGGLGSSESTRQASIKILAEGMKLGLDDSKFAEENRRFTELTSQIISQSGARGGSDFERVSGGFGRFLGENTNAGVGAAKTAYEQYQQVSSTTTGPRGVMRAAGFMSDPNLSKLSTMTKQALMQLPESELNEDHPVVQAAANEAGVSAKDIVGSVSNTNQGAVSRFKQADQLRDKIRGYAKSVGKERLSREDISNAPKSVQADFNQLATYQTAEFGNKGQRETESFALGTVNGTQMSPFQQANRESAINEKLGGGGTGRMEDTTVRAMASDSRVVLQNFNDMAPAMKSAAESTAAWTREIREANAALQQALESARQNKNTDTLKTVEDMMKRMSTAGGTQGQAGRQSK